MSGTRIRGSFVALVTPFRDGKVDEDALKGLIDWHMAEGTHGIVPVGTTGESPTLTHAEHERVIALTVAHVGGAVPVIAGTGSNNTTEALRFTRQAAEAGADAALVVTPYYNKPVQAGLVAHYRALHDCADIPIMIYNIPGRSIIDMSPATMGELARLPRIIGVKDATGDLARVMDTTVTCGREFIQFSGEDATAVGYNAMGGTGCISVTANVAPRLCSEMQSACLSGDYATAREIQDRLAPLHRALFLESNPSPAKYALSLLGRCGPEVRAPLIEVSGGTKEAVHAAMVQAGLINH